MPIFKNPPELTLVVRSSVADNEMIVAELDSGPAVAIEVFKVRTLTVAPSACAEQ